MQKPFIENSKITIILNYENIDIKAQFRSFDILNQVKKKIYTIFYPIPNDIILKYGNLNISNYLYVKLGNLFPHKKSVKIDVIKKLNSSYNILKPINKNNLKIEKKISPFIYKNTKLILPPINKNLIHNISKNIIKEYPIKKIMKYSNSQQNILTSAVKLKSLKNNKNKNLIKEINFNEKILKSENNKINNKCMECFFKEIKFFCRKCNNFLCENCIHTNHLKIEIDNNFDLGLVKYKEKLNYILSESNKSFDNLENIKKKKIDFDIWNSRYAECIDKLIITANNIKDEKIKEIAENKNLKKEKNIFMMVKKEYKDIKNVKCEIYRDPFETFSEINNIEKEIYNLINTLKINNKKKTLKEKIDGMFSDIENEIDKIMFQLEEQAYNCQINNNLK